MRRLNSCGRMLGCLCSETLKDEWLGFILNVDPEIFVSTSMLKHEKNDSKLDSIFGSRKATPKMGIGAVVLQK